MPRLAVLMPVRSGEYLHKAIQSTLGALPRDARLYVFDDGSNPRTQSLLADLQGPRLAVVGRNDTSRGVSSALNTLLATTDSEFVARMDADDVCLPWRFAYSLRNLQEADIAFTSIVRINADGRVIGVDQPGAFSVDAVPYHLLLGNALVHPTMIARRSSLAPLGGYRASVAEDYDLWLRAVRAGHRLKRLPVPTLAYRHHAGAVSSAAPWAGGVDPIVVEAYEALASEVLPEVDASVASRMVFGGLRELTQLELRDFSARFRDRASRLPWAQQKMVLRRLAAVLRREFQHAG